MGQILRTYVDKLSQVAIYRNWRLRKEKCHSSSLNHWSNNYKYPYKSYVTLNPTFHISKTFGFGAWATSERFLPM